MSDNGVCAYQRSEESVSIWAILFLMGMALVLMSSSSVWSCSTPCHVVRVYFIHFVIIGVNLYMVSVHRNHVWGILINLGHILIFLLSLTAFIYGFIDHYLIFSAV